MQIWAEAGQCQGDVKYALDAVDAIAMAGADAIKIQVLRPEKIASPGAVRYDAYGNGLLQRDAFSRFLSYDAWANVAERAKKAGIGFVAAVFDEEAVDAMSGTAHALKIASGDITNRPLIEAAAAGSGHGELVISTGAATEEEVLDAVRWAWGVNANLHLALLACHLQYPTHPGDAHLGRVIALGNLVQQKKWGAKVTVGYSDHTTGTSTTPLLVAMGVAIQEKHFTMLGKGNGGDHEFGVMPSELKDMCDARDGIVTMFGNIELEPSQGERAARAGARRSVHATRGIAKGELITRDNTEALRPCVEGAVQPAEWDELIRFRSVALEDVKEGQVVMRVSVGMRASVGAFADEVEKVPPTASGRGIAKGTLSVE